MEFRRYTPKFKGNRESKTPFTVDLHYLSEFDLSVYARKLKKLSRSRDNDDADFEIRDLQFVENIGEIRGLVDEFTGEPIVNAEQLSKAFGYLDLATELRAEMETAKDSKHSVSIKNSEPPSAGHSGKGNGGTAKAV